MKKITLFTDGACSGNPGPGGWGAILRYGEKEKELCGGEEKTTNNRMELTAVIKGLSALKEPCEVTLVSDSKYVIDALERGWVWAWRSKGWRNSRNEPTPNTDLWEQLLPLINTHSLTCSWIRGHTGHAENERCDQMAVGYYQTHYINT